MSFNNCIDLCGKGKTWYFPVTGTRMVSAGPGGKDTGSTPGA